MSPFPYGLIEGGFSMKRFLALALTLVMLALSLSGCSLYYRMFGIDEDYTGPVYYMYLGDMPTTMDPAFAYLDDSSMAVMSLIYEGLYKYDEKGEATEALAESCKEISFDDKTGELVLEISIRDSCWSDQIHVQADQFIFAWRRLLEPSFSSPASVLLYDIKNAKEIKTASGSITKYDLGVQAVDTRVLHITLVGQKLEDGSYAKPSIKAFKEKLASPMLVPVRSDKVSKLTDWATSNESVPSNGPFYLRSYQQRENAEAKKDREIRLQRNVYYLRDQTNDPLDKYVKPYQIVLRHTIDAEKIYDDKGSLLKSTPVFTSTSEQALYYFKNGYLDYTNYIPLDARADYASDSAVVRRESLFTHAYLFNTKNPVLAKPEVRRALSLALDREELASSLVYAKPALSILTDAAKEPGGDDAFNNHLTSGVSEKANMSEAKKLLEQAGVTSGSFTITVKEGDEVSAAAAAYCAGVWKELGFDVTLRTMQTKIYVENDYNGIFDTYLACYKANGAPFNNNAPTAPSVDTVEGFDVIAVDLLTNSTDPFTTLAPFSKYFSGMSIDMATVTDDQEPALPMTSYDSKRFNLCISDAAATPVKKAKAAYLHAAEEQLMNDMPVMPLFRIENSVLQKDGLKNVTYSLYGVPCFTEMKLSGYEEVVFADIQAKVIEERKKQLEK